MTKPCIIALLALLCLACDDDDETRPRYRSDVTVEVGGTPVASLGDRDLERICQSFDVYVDTHVSFDAVAYIACLPQAIVLSADEQDCEQRLDECMALFPEPIEVRAQLEDTEVCYSSLRSCNASVADLDGCINVNLDLALDIIDNWSCSGAGDEDIRAQAARAMDTANVCADIDAACNDFATLGPD